MGRTKQNKFSLIFAFHNNININMIFANGPNSTSSRQSPQHCSCIAMVPTAGESSPTSVLVDVTVDCPNGLSELKRMQSYSDQLLLPQEMVYGNDLIKVWNIDDEAEAEAYTNTNYYQSMVCLEEEATYNKTSISQSQPQLQARPETMQETIPAPPLSPPSPLEDIDDLFLALPPSVITLPPRFLPSPLSALSLSSSPPLQVAGAGTTNTIVLDNNDIAMDLDDENENEAVPVPATTRPSRGHRRGHRRNHSHFDFQFQFS